LEQPIIRNNNWDVQSNMQSPYSGDINQAVNNTHTDENPMTALAKLKSPY